MLRRCGHVTLARELSVAQCPRRNEVFLDLITVFSD